jgi:hypothetical protein
MVVNKLLNGGTMSRKKPLLLLKLLQGAASILNNNTNREMNLKSPDCNRFAAMNPLLLINQLNAGSVTILLVLGVIGIESAQANYPTESTTYLQKSQAQQDRFFNTLPESESEVSPRESSKLANNDLSYVGTPRSQEVIIVNKSTEQASNYLPDSSVVAVKVVGNMDSVLQPTPEIEQSGEGESSQYLLSCPKGCIPKDNLAQLPYSPQPLPVPSTPIPLGIGGSNSPIRQIPYFPQPPTGVPTSGRWLPVPSNSYNPMMGQPQYYQQAPMPVMGYPQPSNSYNPMMGQPQYYQQAPLPMMGYAQPSNSYNPMMGQSPYPSQTFMLVPVQATGYPVVPSNYNPMMGQSPYPPQSFMLVPAQATGYPVGFNNYNPNLGQPQYYPQAAPPLPAPLNPNPVGYNYNPNLGQPQYYPQAAPPLPAPLNSNPVGYNYNPNMGQPQYYPQATPPNPVVPNNYNPNLGQSQYYPQVTPPNPLVPNNYNPNLGQSQYYPQTLPPVPVQQTPNPLVPNNYNPNLVQPQYYPQATPSLPIQQTPIPVVPNNNNPTLGQSPLLPVPPVTNNQQPTNNNQQQPSLVRSTALTPPSLQLQGLYINQGSDSSARARLGALYPLTPQVQFGATLDLTSAANRFADSPGQGLNINELYFSVAPVTDLPNLRLVAGQLDLTSYFDRNSFAKDSATHFFNSVFQTNPALSTTGIASRPGFLVNWTLTDNIEAKAAVFSSSRSIGDFTLDGFAGEIGLRLGNAIIRGTYASDRDAGLRDGFKEMFQATRSDGTKGSRPSDREDAYGVNAEYFIPQLNMGIFGRYGRYENQALRRGGNTYSLGITFLDLISKNDRLGLAYGRALSNEQLRREAKADVPDVLELFYDFRFLSNLRLGFTLQQRNSFEDTYAGFRLKTEFDVTPRVNLVP